MKLIFKYLVLVSVAFFPLKDLSAQEYKENSKPAETISSGSIQTANDSLIKIGFLSLNSYSESGPEIRAAFDFLKEQEKLTSEYITFTELRKHPDILNHFDLLWFHRPDSTGFHDEETNTKILRIINKYLDNGGNLFLTLDAFKYIVPLGLETVPPRDSIKPCVDVGNGRKLGLHSFRQHPVFSGLNGGAYIWAPVRDLTTRITGYFGNIKPEKGKVIAVDWDYIFLREESKLLIEYNPGKGKVIAAGAYTRYSEPNFNRAHLELFTINIFSYLTNTTRGAKEYYWDYSPVQVVECPLKVQDTDPAFLAIPESIQWLSEPDLQLNIDRTASSDFWDVAGERMLAMGIEKGGIEEIWAHPFMALRDYVVGIRFENQDTICWLNTMHPEIEVSPAAFTRSYKFTGAFLTEIIVNDPFDPSGVIHYEYNGNHTAELIIRFKSNLRLMWPYSENVLGSICHGWDKDYEAFVIRDKSGEFVTMLGGNKKPLMKTYGHFSSISYDTITKSFTGVASNALEMAALIMYPLKMNDRLDIVFAAASEGNSVILKYYDKAIHDPYRIYRRSDSAYKELLDKHLVITTPDNNFNIGYKWALIATNRFFVSTPGMGKSLVAGYSTTARGWNGRHKVNGRPGYGWYFGRDGQWSGFALLDYGDFDKVKSELEFYRKYQDLSGKIFHEATTSGVVHYDASDATPLYLVLAGRYFRQTNDTAFLRQNWPAIKKATDFCFSTDTDQDHLIENTNVGHGWVEGGELYGSHATLYLNSCWAAALEEVYNMSLSLNLPETDSYRTESRILKKIINKDFWNDKGSFYFYGKNKDQSYRPEPTILPAVTLYFKSADREKAKLVLKQYASNAFTTNWGSRIIRNDSPLFNPRGYHYGSVWPLFTGWTSLAEYAYGNYQQGFSHLMDNLNVYKNWGLGFVEEVLNGEEYLPSGVCPHQCWSETMVLQPAIEGMLGLDVKTQENKVIIAPHLPSDWDSLNVSNIKAGEQAFNFTFRRTGNRCRYQFKPEQIHELNLEFLPSFPPGTIFTKVTANGEEVPVAALKTLQNTILITKFTFTDTLNIDIEVDKGIIVLPVTTENKPGDKAAGLRLISSRLTENQYIVELEGKPGSTELIRIYINGQEIEKTENGKIIRKKGNIVDIEVVFEAGIASYSNKTVTIFLK
jgi:glycogen debranching enzyme